MWTIIITPTEAKWLVKTVRIELDRTLRQTFGSEVEEPFNKQHGRRRREHEHTFRAYGAVSDGCS